MRETRRRFNARAGVRLCRLPCGESEGVVAFQKERTKRKRRGLFSSHQEEWAEVLLGHRSARRLGGAAEVVDCLGEVARLVRVDANVVAACGGAARW